MSVIIYILKVIEEDISREKYFFKTFSAIWKMFLPFNTISYNIQGGSVKRQGVVLRDNEHHPSNLRMNRKQNCLYIPLMFQKLFVQLYNNWKVA